MTEEEQREQEMRAKYSDLVETEKNLGRKIERLEGELAVARADLRIHTGRTDELFVEMLRAGVRP